MFSRLITYQILHGALVQLGERLNGIEKVKGSNPLSSTFPKGYRLQRQTFGKATQIRLPADGWGVSEISISPVDGNPQKHIFSDE